MLSIQLVQAQASPLMGFCATSEKVSSIVWHLQERDCGFKPCAAVLQWIVLMSAPPQGRDNGPIK